MESVRARTTSAAASPARAALAADLVEAARSLVRAAARAAGPGERSGLTGAQLDLLVYVSRNPDRTVAEVAADLRLARNTVSTLVGQLTRDGLLERIADPDDGRVARLRTQPAAGQRMAAWRVRRVEAVAQALSALDPDALDALGRAVAPLRRVGQHLEAGPDTDEPVSSSRGGAR